MLVGCEFKINHTLIAKALGVRKYIVMASMDAVLGCMNVLTTDYNNQKTMILLLEPFLFLLQTKFRH
ncbi:MAG: hypothetical protein NWE94_05480 [Candidatus Bathyarchaeota archaeon]|nr:hypothetical protein [Candidatus Bathyarchaeota archaeon]